MLPAATVLIVEDRPSLEVLVLRRRAGSDFVGGMYVFPGGGVDDEDADPAWAPRLAGRDDAGASAELGVARGGLAFWVAAVRETYEEAGVLLAAGSTAPGPPELRRAVDAGEVDFLDAAERLDAHFDLSTVHHVGRWITPIGPTRRYDTHFFVAELPAGQRASHDGVEAVGLEWVRAGDALDRWRSGELRMLPPTVCMLQQLARYATAAEVLDAAASAPAPGAVARTTGSEFGDYAVMLPGDPGYEAATPTLGWVRLGTAPDMMEP